MATAETLARELSALYSLPEAALRVSQLIDQPDSHDRELAEVIMHDPALTARLLRLVNSPYFGLSRHIESPGQAITLIGRQRLRVLLLATAVTTTLPPVAQGDQGLEAYWEHSVNAAVLARQLGRRLGLADPERLFAAGLLHLIGRLAFRSSRLAAQHRAVTAKALDEAGIEAAEQAAFGFTQHALGLALLTFWQLPASLLDLISTHRDPALATEAERLPTQALHAASRIAAWMNTGSPIEALQLGPASRLQLALTNPVIEELVGDTHLEALEILGIIAPDAALIF